MLGSSDDNVSKALDMITTSLSNQKSLLSNSGINENNESRREVDTSMNNFGCFYYSMIHDHMFAPTIYSKAYSLRKEHIPEIT